MSGIEIQSCPACAKTWYLPRQLCPGCGHASPESRQASGHGTVWSVTRVERAPDETFRAIAPYLIALVDLAEGPRVMAHLTAPAPISAQVTGEVRDIAGRALPVFSPR